VLRLTRLRLQDFRNYERLSWTSPDGEPGRVTVFTGPNGSGKTNLLEAVSLLVPGRGLRGARTAEFLRSGAPSQSWGIAARLDTPTGPLEIGTGADPASPDRRAFRLDGAAPRTQSEIAARLAVVWLTPQMDTLFQEPASGRRRFLDRLVYALEPAHARQLAAHDTAQSQRARLLATTRPDPAWLAALEDSIARHAVAVTAARLSLVARLNQALQHGAAAGFPIARMTLLGPIGDHLAAHAALATEDWLRAAQAQSRAKDAQSGAASYGAQRADMALADHATDRSADLASTGQRKALLIGVVLGHAALIAALRGTAPILLLDEPMVHLDAERRALLCAAVCQIQAQFLLTGTDPEVFHPLRDTAGYWRAQDGSLQP
jgi:DNA replication and repair protein RecF